MNARRKQRRGYHADTIRTAGTQPVDVDKFVDQLPAIERLARRVRTLVKRIDDRITDRDLWVAYSDALFALRLERESRFFEFGYEYGRLAGRAETAQSQRDQTTRTFARQLREAVVASGLPRVTAVVLLLETARALAIGLFGSIRSSATEPWRPARGGAVDGHRNP